MSGWKERELNYMPYDKMFDTNEGNEELCHATGIEVLDPSNGEWWNEYVDSNGEYHYGR